MSESRSVRQRGKFRRTHDLYELADRIEQASIALPRSAEELGLLNPYAVEFRYGDQTIPLITREEAEALAQDILKWANAIVEEKERSQ